MATAEMTVPVTSNTNDRSPATPRIISHTGLVSLSVAVYASGRCIAACTKA